MRKMGQAGKMSRGQGDMSRGAGKMRKMGKGDKQGR